jgi:hypothetical protein
MHDRSRRKKLLTDVKPRRKVSRIKSESEIKLKPPRKIFFVSGDLIKSKEPTPPEIFSECETKVRYRKHLLGCDVCLGELSMKLERICGSRCGEFDE